MNNKVIANISTVGLFKNESEESYSLISFLDLPSESKRLFHNSLSEFADVEYNRCGVTTGDIEILVPVGDDDSAIVYGSYLIECSVE